MSDIPPIKDPTPPTAPPAGPAPVIPYGREGPAPTVRAHKPGVDHERIEKVEILISNLLRTGVLVSLFVVVLGTAMSFWNHPSYLKSKSAEKPLTSGITEFPHSLKDVGISVYHRQGRGVVMLGLLLLVATPVLRVAVSIFAFVYQKDRIFVLITSIVLFLLLLSFVLGKAEG